MYASFRVTLPLPYWSIRQHWYPFHWRVLQGSSCDYCRGNIDFSKGRL